MLVFSGYKVSVDSDFSPIRLQTPVTILSNAITSEF